MHRQILGAEKGQQVDHINRNRLDNRRSNLRMCTPSENAKNAGKRRDGLTSNYKGVFFIARNGKYSAAIQVDRKRVSLGYYAVEEDAAYYYNEKAKELHGEFAFLNDLPDGYTPTVGYSPDNARGFHSEYRGVTYCKRDRKYVAKIQHKGSVTNLGQFHTDRIAAEFYNAAAMELHGDKAILNKFKQMEGVIAE